MKGPKQKGSKSKNPNTAPLLRRPTSLAEQHTTPFTCAYHLLLLPLAPQQRSHQHHRLHPNTELG